MTLTPLPSRKGNQDPEENRREAERASLMPPPVPPQELYQTQKHLSQKLMRVSLIQLQPKDNLRGKPETTKVYLVY